MKNVLLTLVTVMMAACGTVDNAVRSEKSIQGKTAFALGTSPDNASAGGELFQCYYATAGIASDVLCSPADGDPIAETDSSCNALLRATNRCS